MSRILTLVTAPVLALFAACVAGGEEPRGAPVSIHGATPEEVGRYFFLIGGCNDCHTPGWAESKGKLPEAEWAMGSAVGFRGPWGVSYPDNLRLVAQALTEQQWVDLFRRGEGPPPMPWQNYHTASTADLAGVYRFLRSLGPHGKPAPGDLPPGKEPTTAYIDLAPRRPVPNGP
jgi:mono/diheme cytochrome c family protein